MIAKNYIRYPEALRFQREMFSNGYHNSPRIMRLMECIFELVATAPQWVKDMKKRAAELVKHWKQCQVALGFRGPTIKTTGNPHMDGYNREMARLGMVRYQGPNGETWSGRGLMPRWLAVRRDIFKEAIDKWLVH